MHSRPATAAATATRSTRSCASSARPPRARTRSTGAGGRRSTTGAISVANTAATAKPEPVRSWTRSDSTTTIKRSPAADSRTAPDSRRRSRGALIGSRVPGLDADPAGDPAVADVGEHVAHDLLAGGIGAGDGERRPVAGGEPVADAADDPALVGGADVRHHRGPAVGDGRRARRRALVD